MEFEPLARPSYTLTVSATASSYMQVYFHGVITSPGISDRHVVHQNVAELPELLAPTVDLARRL